MTLFWMLCAAMLLVATLFIAVPLWRRSTHQDILRDAANLEILRDQSSELDADLHNGLLTQDAYDQGKRELQGRLVDEINPGQPAGLKHNPAKTLAIVLVVLLPLFTLGLYHKVGTPRAVQPGATSAQVDDSPVTTEEELKALQESLADNPENAHGWFKLAGSYIVMKRYTEAADAYDHLVKLVPDEAQIWANYADVYAMAHGKSLQNEQVGKMLAQALELDPSNITALALSGSVAMERQDYPVAITQWQKMVAQLDTNSPEGQREAQRFISGIQQARDLLAAQPGGKVKLAQLPAMETAPQQAAAGGAAITGEVKLSPALKGKVSPDDTVFVLARAAQGPKMPLAVMKKQVKDLPLQFSLDDSMAMNPQLKLSGFDQVVVVARVAKSGTPMAQSGDLQGMSDVVKPGASKLSITIDSVMP